MGILLNLAALVASFWGVVLFYLLPFPFSWGAGLLSCVVVYCLIKLSYLFK